MRTKIVKVGIMSFKVFQKYTKAIASGKYKPQKNAPKIWFESVETCMQILSTKNIELLKLMYQQATSFCCGIKSLSNIKAGMFLPT